MKTKKIAKYARMASNELHDEWMMIDQYGMFSQGHFRDIMSEVIDKLDYIEAMANDNWFKKILRKVKYGRASD